MGESLTFLDYQSEGLLTMLGDRVRRFWTLIDLLGFWNEWRLAAETDLITNLLQEPEGCVPRRGY